jgi:hypothetical protein
MLPSLRIVKGGLRRATEALATEIAAPRPGSTTPEWSELEWQLAAAAAAAHGVSPLLSTTSTWQNAPWQSFLAHQREHVAQRFTRIAVLLERIDRGARAAGLPIVPLKGAALHALGVYLPGERPMADIDLLVRECDVAATNALLETLGYEESLATWKHRSFKPMAGRVMPGLGEHRDTQITIELHTCIQERLPVSAVEITARIYPTRPQPGLNPYPSIGALMSHLLLHTAGNICSRTLRLLHLNDIARLAARMTDEDWNVLWVGQAGEPPWWALPPLRLTARYYHDAIPASVLARVTAGCPALLRMTSRRQTLTHASCSDLWIQTFPGIEWSRSVREAGRYISRRIKPGEDAHRERMGQARTQAFLQGQSWARLSRGRQILLRLTRPVPRMDALYVVRAALARDAGAP